MSIGSTLWSMSDPSVEASSIGGGPPRRRRSNPTVKSAIRSEARAPRRTLAMVRGSKDQMEEGEGVSAFAFRSLYASPPGAPRGIRSRGTYAGVQFSEMSRGG